MHVRDSAERYGINLPSSPNGFFRAVNLFSRVMPDQHVFKPVCGIKITLGSQTLIFIHLLQWKGPEPWISLGFKNLTIDPLCFANFFKERSKVFFFLHMAI